LVLSARLILFTSKHHYRIPRRNRAKVAVTCRPPKGPATPPGPVPRHHSRR
jgi:hypothetical protein